MTSNLHPDVVETATYREDWPHYLKRETTVDLQLEVAVSAEVLNKEASIEAFVVRNCTYWTGHHEGLFDAIAKLTPSLRQPDGTRTIRLLRRIVKPHVAEHRKALWEADLVKLGQLLAKPNKLHVHITNDVRAFKALGHVDDSLWRSGSCYRSHRMHGYAPQILYEQIEDTIVVFLFSEGEIVGRCWGVYSPNNYLALSNLYGTILKDLSTLTRLIGDELGLRNKALDDWSPEIAGAYSNDDGAAVGQAPDEYYNDGIDSMCCSGCERYHLDDDMYIQHGSAFCPSCVEEMTACDCCEQLESEDYMSTVWRKGEQLTVCENCAGDYRYVASEDRLIHESEVARCYDCTDRTLLSNLVDNRCPDCQDEQNDE